MERLSKSLSRTHIDDVGNVDPVEFLDVSLLEISCISVSSLLIEWDKSFYGRLIRRFVIPKLNSENTVSLMELH